MVCTWLNEVQRGFTSTGNLFEVICIFVVKNYLSMVLEYLCMKMKCF